MGSNVKGQQTSSVYDCIFGLEHAMFWIILYYILPNVESVYAHMFAEVCTYCTVLHTVYCSYIVKDHFYLAFIHV